MSRIFLTQFLAVMLVGQLAWAEDAGKVRSHPPLRVAPPASNRPNAKGPAFFVDAQRGDDEHDGSQAAPWKSVQHAVEQLKGGDTLYLRGGTYYEQVAVRLVGQTEAPITIRSYPGEQAILDGGLPEFMQQPTTAWEASPGGVEGEFRSTRSYPNLRHVMGSFGDSMVGLVTYYHAQDLRAPGELTEPDEAAGDVKPLYCGPGLWYDPATGRIHARLKPTNLPSISNYRGESDPRKLPLVIAPYRSVPLHVDGASHVRFQDLIIRGAGFTAVIFEQSQDIEFDNVTVWCGTYGFKATGLQRFKFYRSALYGSIPPWLGRGDAGLRTYPGRKERDIARLNTHASFTPDSGREFSVYYFPFNDDWDIGHSEFTDASDGPYLGSVNVKFHHNLVDGMQDDGLYLSPMYPRPERFIGKAKIEIYQNSISRVLTALAFGGPETVTDTIYLYRNIIDLRAPVNTGRPSAKEPQAVTFNAGHVMGDHGGPPWPTMFSYHNTIISREGGRGADLALTNGTTKDRPRHVFNNIIVHGQGLSAFNLPASPFLQSNGNIFWQPNLKTETAAAFFTAYRSSPAFAGSKQTYPPGLDASSLAVDPKFLKSEMEPQAVNDYRLQPGSPAVDAGQDLPAEWPDPLRMLDKGKSDIGALPLGAEPVKFGRLAAPRP